MNGQYASQGSVLKVRLREHGRQVAVLGSRVRVVTSAN